MKLLRQVEQSLENLMDGVTARVFRGSLHPTELANRLIRELDLHLRTGDQGPVAPNVATIRISAFDLGDVAPPPSLEGELSELVEAISFERGWRLEGNADVAVLVDRRLAPGVLRYDLSERPGDRPPWAFLRTAGGKREVQFNRSTIGRGSTCDIIIDDSTVSRVHALIWREAERTHLKDLGSANGTKVDGALVTAAVLEPASLIEFGGTRYRFELVMDV